MRKDQDGQLSKYYESEDITLTAYVLVEDPDSALRIIIDFSNLSSKEWFARYDRYIRPNRAWHAGERRGRSPRRVYARHRNTVANSSCRLIIGEPSTETESDDLKR